MDKSRLIEIIKGAGLMPKTQEALLAHVRDHEMSRELALGVADFLEKMADYSETAAAQMEENADAVEKMMVEVKSLSDAYSEAEDDEFKDYAEGLGVDLGNVEKDAKTKSVGTIAAVNDSIHEGQNEMAKMSTETPVPFDVPVEAPVTAPVEPAVETPVATPMESSVSEPVINLTEGFTSPIATNTVAEVESLPPLMETVLQTPVYGTEPVTELTAPVMPSTTTTTTTTSVMPEAIQPIMTEMAPMAAAPISTDPTTPAPYNPAG